jgi:hypothetical protein
MRTIHHMVAFHPSPNHPTSKVQVTITLSAAGPVTDQEAWCCLMDAAGHLSDRINDKDPWQ